MKNSALVLVGFLVSGGAVLSCGGKVTFQDDGGGATNDGGSGNVGNIGTGNTGAVTDVGVGASGPTSISVTSGPSACTAHSDCDAGFLCIFSTGLCGQDCGGDFCSDCGPGMICNGCATSSCPGCDDCESACVPIDPGQCDDSNPCPDGQSCLFGSNTCQTVCGPAGCPPGTDCVGCATGSCCGCKDCVDLCLEFDGIGDYGAN